VIVLAHTQEDSQLERAWTEHGLGSVDGVLLASSRMSDSTIRMIAKQKPTIVLNRRLPEVPSVVTDNAPGVRRAVEHLGELGHESITYLAGPETSWADGMRWQALREAALELGLGVPDRPVHHPDGGRRLRAGDRGDAPAADGAAGLQRRHGGRRAEGAQAARASRPTSASSASTTSCWRTSSNPR
jgi:DNA-binding LacI/PurR family transcriptional regulator